MTAKAYLGQARQAELNIQALLERRERCAEMASRRGPEGSKALEALEAELDRRIGEYVEQVRGIEAAIDGVREARCRDVLRYRYLNGWSWQVIAGKMSYSRNWLWKLHARGLEEIEGSRE